MKKLKEYFLLIKTLRKRMVAIKISEMNLEFWTIALF